MSWIRLEASFGLDSRLDEIGFWGRVTFVGAMTLSKLHGWSVGFDRGFLPERDFTARAVLRYWDCSHVSGAEAGVREAIAALVASEVLIRDDKNRGWWIANWKKYQPDTTASQRQQNFRNRLGDKPVTPRNNPAQTQKHPPNGTIQPQSNGVSRGVTGNSGCHADVTGRDVTENTEPLQGSGVLLSSPPHTLSVGGGGPASEAAAAPPADPLEAAREAARRNGTAYAPK
jgi:hypothetical protein